MRFPCGVEARLSLVGLGAKAGQSVKLQLSIWQRGLPVDAIPPQGLAGSIDSGSDGLAALTVELDPR